MTTGTEVIKGALSDFLGITNYSADDAMLAFRELNDMIPVIEAKYSLGIQTITNISDQIDIPDHAVSYVKKSLGAAVSGSFGKTLTPELVSSLRIAEGGVVVKLDLKTTAKVSGPFGIANIDQY